MTVAFDSSLETISTATDPVTISFTPVATLAGIAVLYVQAGNASALISTMKYGGVDLAFVVAGADTATELGRADIWFLGAGVPSGTQDMVIDLTNGAGTKQVVIVGLTGAADLTVLASGSLSENQANPQIALNAGAVDAVFLDCVFSGLPNTTDLTNVANTTRIDDHDYGAAVSVVSRKTTVVSGSFTMGYTASTDDVAMAAVAIGEIAVGGAVDPYPYVGGGYYPVEG